jgi:pimeloyl-ACP methyl ester carboxylesterase
MIDTIIHRWLRVPYPLHVRVNREVAHPRATVLFIHGIGHSGAVWDEIVDALPKDLRCITIDLLGFGDSPQPTWALYSAKTQAHSVIATALRLRLSGPVIIVGHSLGALVAVEVARRYPLLVSSLILCSPPFYQLESSIKSPLPNTEKLLWNIYQVTKKYPARLVAISRVAKKYNLVNRTFNLSEDNVSTYMNALEATVVNQTSINDALHLKKYMTIIYGTLDPVVVPRNLRMLAQAGDHISLVTILAGHELRGRFIPAIVQAVESHSTKKS